MFARGAFCKIKIYLELNNKLIWNYKYLSHPYSQKASLNSWISSYGKHSAPPSTSLLHEGELDWFDDNWNWDVLPTRMLYELLLSPTYRRPWKVKVVYTYRWGAEFPRCPRCWTTMEREYQLFCDHCGQRLNWSRFDDVEVQYIGWWDGKEDD